MIELINKAANYAAEKTNEVMTTAIAQAYADGYRDGYKDCEEEIPVDLRDNKTEYVDLGLPSGTLWATDYAMEKGNTKYLSYGEASQLSIPTNKQWQELISQCECESNYCKDKGVWQITFIGPNGKFISFLAKGYKKSTSLEHYRFSGCYWILDQNNELKKTAAFFDTDNKMETTKLFEGFKLPVRLVRHK